MNYIKSLVAPAIIGTSISLSSCNSDTHSQTEQSRREVLSELMADKPMTEYDKIINNIDKKVGYLKDSQAQSSLDSVAYRNVFEGTILAQDSTKVKEFNNIARNMRPNEKQIDYKKVTHSLDNKTKDLGITKRNFDANQEEYNKIREWRSRGITSSFELDHDRIIATRQFKADSMAYEKFFKDNGVLTDSLKKQLKSIAKKVKP